MAQPRAGKIIAVTGASGYIGSRFVGRALDDGHAVVALGRRPLRRDGVADLAFDLARPVVPALPPDLDALVHLAANTSGTASVSPDHEIRALETLAAALPKGCRLVFVSSQSASADAVASYGQTKWAAEAVVARLGGVSVRPGLVYGGPEQGLYGRICALVRRLPVLPRFVRPRPLVQPVHIDDLVDGLLRVALGRGQAGAVLELAQPRPMSFDAFLGEIARRRFGTRKLFVPVPLGPVLRLLAIAALVLRRDVGGAQLGSLARTRAMDTAADLDALSLTLRPLADGLAATPPRGRVAGRRARLDEGRRLLAYILAAGPGLSLVVRYARTLEARSEDAIVACRGMTARSSLALAILDHPGRHPWERDLQERLDLALWIAEASPQSFDRFVGKPAPHPQRLRAVAAVASAVGREALVRLLRLVAIGPARRVLQSRQAVR